MVLKRLYDKPSRSVHTVGDVRTTCLFSLLRCQKVQPIFRNDVKCYPPAGPDVTVVCWVGGWGCGGGGGGGGGGGVQGTGGGMGGGGVVIQ